MLKIKKILKNNFYRKIIKYSNLYLKKQTLIRKKYKNFLKPKKTKIKKIIKENNKIKGNL